MWRDLVKTVVYDDRKTSYLINEELPLSPYEKGGKKRFEETKKKEREKERKK